VVAFLGLALLNLAAGIGSAGVRLECEAARNLVGAVIPILLLIGMAHVETLFRGRTRRERLQSLRLCELEQCLDRKTEELAEAREEFRLELTRREQAQRAFAEWAQQDRLELGAHVAAKAGQHLNRHLAVIELYARLLRANHSAPLAAQYHERLAAGAAEAAALGRQLLASGRCQPLRTQLLSLSDIVRRHTPVLRDLLGEHQRLECACPADEPLVLADPQAARWMLEELVRNARDATAEAGCVRISVEGVSAHQPHPGQNPGAGQFASIVVTDTGRGMDREVQAHLGEPFSTQIPGERAGLGLASVIGLIKAHGGWLQVTSALGHGTQVRLFFPAAAACPHGTSVPTELASSREDRL